MSRRVLSVQSHVVHGHVGNKSATFPLQLLGFNVDPLNTVQFSNHTGYGFFTGQRLDGAQILDLIAGLERNTLLDQYSHLLTGYLGTESILAAVLELARKLKSRPHPPLFLMDPVLGDNNQLYVPKELVEMYRDKLCPHADIITPNGFEAELLSGVDRMTSYDRVELALSKLHALGPECVVITSVDFDASSPTLALFASHLPSKTLFSIEFPKLEGSFTGTGDLFAALLLARIGSTTAGMRIDKESLVEACEMAVATMHHVLNETIVRMRKQGVDEKEAGHDMKFRELCLIESKRWIEAPEIEYRAVMRDQ
ncbi:hypothetical protein HDU98_009953 [Podochytrium sp. JEL0797]|nr:hypothetical protein HDU98_009953 [Podochytrium sp. JEL0797]